MSANKRRHMWTVNFDLDTSGINKLRAPGSKPRRRWRHSSVTATSTVRPVGRQVPGRTAGRVAETGKSRRRWCWHDGRRCLFDDVDDERRRQSQVIDWWRIRDERPLQLSQSVSQLAAVAACWRHILCHSARRRKPSGRRQCLRAAVPPLSRRPLRQCSSGGSSWNCVVPRRRGDGSCSGRAGVLSSAHKTFAEQRPPLQQVELAVAAAAACRCLLRPACPHGTP